MKHTDLMLNDLVMCQGKILRVGCISDYDIKIDLFEDGEDTPYAEIWQEELDEVEPIPLTTEMLEKNGWKYNDMPFVQGWEQYGILLYACSSGYRINCGTNIALIIDSVHELQHALRLCGIDKEIVL